MNPRTVFLVLALVLLPAVAGAQDFSGSYSAPSDAGGITLNLQGGPGGEVTGTLSGNGLSYPLSGARDEAEAGVAYGTLEVPGGILVFEARLVGEELWLALYDLTPAGEIDTANATELRLTRSGVPAAPAAAAGGSPVVARGSYADLTRDDALAFIEALAFALNQAGYVDSLGDDVRAQLFDALVSNFPAGSAEEQIILSRARQIWSEAQAGWPQASDDDRRAFVLAVFTLAFGEEAVQAAAGGGGGGGGGGGCATFEDCAGSYMDGDTYLDAQNAQSCWASAGCGSYDSGSDTFYDSSGEPY